VSASRLVSRWGLLVVFAIIFGGFSAWLPTKFPTSGNVQDILTSQPPGIFIAFAAMLVLVVGEFDLSIGATLGMAQYLVLKLITHYGLSWEAAIVATLAVGAAIGAANAIAVIGLGINSFIATIGIATILEGLIQWISSGSTPIFGGAPTGFTTLAQTKQLVVLPVYYALGARCGPPAPTGAPRGSPASAPAAPARWHSSSEGSSLRWRASSSLRRSAPPTLPRALRSCFPRTRRPSSGRPRFGPASSTFGAP
jgi:hypothetical protein